MNAFRLRCFVLILAIAGVLSIIGPPGGAAASPVVEDDPDSRAQLSNIGLAYYLFDAVFNGNDPEAAASLVANNAVIDTPSGEFTGPEGALEYVANVTRTYPHASFAITSLSVTDEQVVVGWTMTSIQIETDTSGTFYETPLELDGVYTITVGDGEVAHLSTDSGYLVAEGPSADTASVPPEIVRGQPS